MDFRDASEICRECGALCCCLGGTRATKDEIDTILKAGHESHFVRVADNCYITPWGEEGVCPYLADLACTIYDVRPLICQKFPVAIFSNRERFIVHCAFTLNLSEEEIDHLVELSSIVPTELIEEAAAYLQPYAQILDQRFRAFRLSRLNNDGMNTE